MRYTLRDLVYIGVFGALWGAVESTAGSVLHMLNVPFAGAVLSALGITIALIGRLYVPQRGSLIFIGCVAALLKLFSLGGVVLNPILGILMESLLAEGALILAGHSSRFTFAWAGALAVLSTLAQPFVTQGLLAGQGLLVIYVRTIERGAGALGVNPALALVVLGLLAALHLLLGAAAGVLAWDGGRLTVSRRALQMPDGAR